MQKFCFLFFFYLRSDLEIHKKLLEALYFNFLRSQLDLEIDMGAIVTFFTYTNDIYGVCLMAQPQ
jgi:hypothetical protein